MVAMNLWLQYRIAQLVSKEDGAAAVEYGLLVGLIAVAIIATVLALGGRLNEMFEAVSTALQGATPAPATT